MNSGNDDTCSDLMMYARVIHVEFAIPFMKSTSALMQSTKTSIEISGFELGGAGLSVAQIQETALAYVRKNLQGCCVMNGATGLVIRFGRRGLNKTLRHAARREHAQSVVALLPLMERADWICTEMDRNVTEFRNIPVVHTVYALLKIRYSLLAVRLIVKQANSGQLLCRGRSDDTETVGTPVSYSKYGTPFKAGLSLGGS